MKLWKWHILTDAELAQKELDAKKPICDRLQLLTIDLNKANQQVCRILHQKVIVQAQLDTINADIKARALSPKPTIRRHRRRGKTK